MTTRPGADRTLSLDGPDGPSITVVVPTHERPEPLRRAVQAIVDQDHKGRIDVIVVFDKSEPHDVDVSLPADRSVRSLVNTRTPGLAGARNTGLLAATGQLVAFCDDDDLWLPGKIAGQVAVLATEPGALLAGCGITLQHGDQRLPRRTPPGPVTHDQLLHSRVAELHPSTFLARREAVLADVGLVDEEIPGSYCEDYDWLLRVSAVAPVLMLAAPLVVVMWQTGSLFAGRWATITDALTYLLDKHPDLAADPVGAARLEGQIAFAQAALGRRRPACRWAVRALRHSPRELRAYLALGVSGHVVSVDRIHAAAHRRGRGI